MTRKLMLVGAAAVAIVTLSACNQTPGAAAYVGDHRISTQEVQEDSAEVIAAASTVSKTPLDGSEVNRRQVNRLITQQLIIDEAARRGLTVTDSEVDALVAQAVGTSTREQFEGELAAAQLVPPSKIDTFARTVALNQKLLKSLDPNGTEETQTAAVVKVLGELSTQLGTGVAPRYGTWDPKEVTVTLPPDDLSVPVPVASASAQVTSGTDQSN